jgi:hypothetical protein
MQAAVPVESIPKLRRQVLVSVGSGSTLRIRLRHRHEDKIRDGAERGLAELSRIK